MRKILVCFVTLTFLSGCTFGPSPSRQFEYEDVTYKDEQQRTPKKLNTTPTDLGDINANNPNNSYKDYGFYRLQKQEVLGKDGDFALKIDKKQVAKFISYLVVKLPSVDDAITLVTDQEVLIAYRSEGGSEAKEAVKDQVVKTAMSALPSYYHIYTSNDMQNINNIQELEKYGALTDDQLEQKVKAIAEGFDVSEESLHFDKISK
jgi:Sporulation lipoprotein YhcN/YlaJ (Spore_YhcN_YlaJ)